MTIIRYIFTFLLALFISIPAAAQADNWRAEADAEAIAAAADQGQVTIQANGRQVRVTGAEHQTMQVFSMTGRKVAEYAIDANDKTVTLNVPRGWYAVRVGNEVARKIYVP